MEPEDQNDDPNRIQSGYVDEFNGHKDLKSAEESGATNNLNGNQNTSKDDSGVEKAKNAEENPDTGWKNNVSGSGSDSSKASGRFAAAKKKGPLTLIILTVVGGGIGIGGLLSPGLLLVNLKEVMVGKFNSQLASMEARSTNLLLKKTAGVTNGRCGPVINIRCRYSTMSKKQISKFEKAGIKVNYDKELLLGRGKPTSFEFEGRKINASEFTNEIKNNPRFRSATRQAFNSKFAGFMDKFWDKAASKLGISKKSANLDGETDAKRLKSMENDTKTPTDSGTSTPEEVKANNKDYIDPETGDKYTEDAAKKANDAAKKASQLANDVKAGAEAVAKDEATKAAEVLSEATASAEKLGNTLKITGWMDTACTAYKTVRAVGFAAKTVRALQLARYAMIFLNVADQIKAGTAKPEDVAYLGTVLTTEIKNDAGIMQSATDSFGYKYAAYGERGVMSTTASRFLAGGGLTGKLINITSMINNVLHNPKKACKVLGSPLVSAGSLIVGIGMFFVPGVGVAAMGWKDAAQAGAMIAMNVATMFLPALLKDIVAGVLVDKNMVGESAGDAITSGSSGIMGNTAKSGGNAPLTPEQAVAYSGLSNDIAAQYAEEDRLAYSPFDSSNSNTFMGMIVAKLIPYISNMSSLSGVFSSIASITTGSFASLTSQTTKATSVDDYTMCNDFDYRDMNLATDPYCNVMYGIPPEALNADPVAVAEALVGTGDIYDTDSNSTSGKSGEPIPGSAYAKFIASCIDRSNPLGDDDNGSDGSKCLFSDATNKNYYLHYIDQRVQGDMDEDTTTTTTATAATTPDPVPSETLAYCSANYGKYISQSDLKAIYGSSASEVSGSLAPVDLPFTGGTKTIQVHTKAAPCFKAVAQALATVSFRPTTNDGTFNWRSNRNDASSLSFHSFGIAIDLDAAQNPNGGGTPPACTTNMPTDFVDVWKKYGFRWGGNYSSTCDAMHFEWLGGVR